MTLYLPFLLIAFALFFVYLSWTRRAWAIFFLIAFLPSYLVRFHVGPIPMTLLELMILLVALVWVVREWNIRSTWIFPWNGGILFFVLTAAVATLVSSETMSALGLFKAYIVEPIVFYLVAVNTLRSEKHIPQLCFALGFSVVPLAIWSMLQVSDFTFIPPPWDNPDEFRTTSLFPYPNAVGLFVAPIVSLFIGLMFDAKWFAGKQKLFVLTIIVAGIFSAVTAVSQGAWFGMFVTLFFFGFFARPWWRIPLIFSVLIVGAFLVPQTREAVLPVVTFQDTSGEVRLALWEGTWNLLKAHPLTGSGLAGFPKMYETYKLARHTELLLYPHNIFLNFWAELGLFGLLSFVWILGKFFAAGIRVFKRGTDISRGSVAVMGAMLTLIAHGLVDVPFFKNDLAVLFWIFPLLLLLIQKKSFEPASE